MNHWVNSGNRRTSNNEWEIILSFKTFTYICNFRNWTHVCIYRIYLVAGQVFSASREWRHPAQSLKSASVIKSMNSQKIRSHRNYRSSTTSNRPNQPIIIAFRTLFFYTLNTNGHCTPETARQNNLQLMPHTNESHQKEFLPPQPRALPNTARIH